MKDFRSIFPSQYLKASDLEGDTIVTIRKIAPGIVGQGKDADEKPIFYFDELAKGLACNITNGNLIGIACGTYNPDELIGQRITLYPTTTEFAGDPNTPCIRVRPRQPNAPANTNSNNNGGNNHQRPAFARSTQSPAAPPPADEFNYSDDDAFATKLATSFETRGFDEESILECVQEVCRKKDVADVYGLVVQDRKSFLASVQTGRMDAYKAGQRRDQHPALSGVERVA